MEIEKESTYTITLHESEIKKLLILCELARVYLQEHKEDIYAGGGLSLKERKGIDYFIREVQGLLHEGGMM